MLEVIGAILIAVFIWKVVLPALAIILFFLLGRGDRK